MAARPAAPKPPLGVLLLASEGLDLVCFGLVATGVEHLQWTPPKRMSVDAEGASSYRWSHGLLVSGVWSAAAAVAGRVYRDRWTAAVIGLLVASQLAARLARPHPRPAAGVRRLTQGRPGPGGLAPG